MQAALANHKKVFSNLDAFDVVSKTDSSSGYDSSRVGPPLKSDHVAAVVFLFLSIARFDLGC